MSPGPVSQELIDETFNAQNIKHLDEEIKRSQNGNMFTKNKQMADNHMLMSARNSKEQLSDGNSSNKLPPISRSSANFNNNMQ